MHGEPRKKACDNFILVQFTSFKTRENCKPLHLYLDFRLTPRCWSALRSSGILRGVVWELFTDVSGQRIGPIFTDQESGSTRTLDPAFVVALRTTCRYCRHSSHSVLEIGRLMSIYWHFFLPLKFILALSTSKVPHWYITSKYKY
jgi:hypothetical protein